MYLTYIFEGHNFMRSDMIIDDISFHDAEILQVTESIKGQQLRFLLSFPTNWEENIFEARTLVFNDVIFYCVNEIPYGSPIAIMQIINHGQIIKNLGEGLHKWEAIRNKIEIQTNAGTRVIECTGCELT